MMPKILQTITIITIGCRCLEFIKVGKYDKLEEELRRNTYYG